MAKQGLGLFPQERRPILSIPPKEKIELMASRLENGEDIWTGEPLQGADADDWVRNQDHEEDIGPELSEEQYRRLLDTLDWFDRNRADWEV